MKKSLYLIFCAAMISASIIINLQISQSLNSISLTSLLKVAYSNSETGGNYDYKIEHEDPVEYLISSEMVCCWQHCNEYEYWTSYWHECFGTGSIQCAEYGNEIFEYTETVCWDI